jgi:hypothetical protein
MALENLKTAYNNISKNIVDSGKRELEARLSVDQKVQETQNLLRGRLGNEPVNPFQLSIGDFANPFLGGLEYSDRAKIGASFGNLGDNPQGDVEKAVDTALKKNLDIQKYGPNVPKFIIDEANRTINSLKSRAVLELQEAAQVPVIGRPTPFIDLAKGPGETNYIDLVSLQPVSTTEVDDQIAPEKRGDFYVKIKDLRNSNIIYFRGYVTGITENVSPSFSSANYIGRSEPVYMYERAERDISFSLKVYPANFTEQKIMYDKMDKLTSLAYPEYAQDVDNDSLTRMKPPFTELYMAHIGKRDRGQFGFIKSISYTVNEQGDWDALRVLPRYFDMAISYQILSKKPPALGDNFYGATV